MLGLRAHTRLIVLFRLGGCASRYRIAKTESMCRLGHQNALDIRGLSMDEISVLDRVSSNYFSSLHSLSAEVRGTKAKLHMCRSITEVSTPCPARGTSGEGQGHHVGETSFRPSAQAPANRRSSCHTSTLWNELYCHPNHNDLQPVEKLTGYGFDLTIAFVGLEPMLFAMLLAFSLDQELKARPSNGSRFPYTLLCKTCVYRPVQTWQCAIGDVNEPRRPAGTPPKDA